MAMDLDLFDLASANDEILARLSAPMAIHDPIQRLPLQRSPVISPKILIHGSYRSRTCYANHGNGTAAQASEHSDASFLSGAHALNRSRAAIRIPARTRLGT